MAWNAPKTVRDAIVDLFTGSAFSTTLTAVNASYGTSAPQVADDAAESGGKAVYTVPRTTYAFPCVEVTPPEGTIPEHSYGSTTSELDVWVYLSYRGTEDELDAWALTYLSALVRVFLGPTVGYEWSPVEFSASPVGSPAEGTYVQAVGVRVRATIAEAI